MITWETFTQDFPEFGSTELPNPPGGEFSQGAFNYWNSVASTLMLNTARWGNGSLAATSPPTTLFDVGLELFVAHMMVLEQQAINTAKVGGVPGVSTGVLSSKAANGVSASYDTTAAIEEGAGHWGLTVYGQRFMWLVKMVGAGPVQIGVGCPPPFSGGAWIGPGGGWRIGESW